MNEDLPLDVLAIMAHPDDAELLCGGALIQAARSGARVGVLDLTRGESGSAGTPELRAREAAAAAEVMGLAVRENAALPDAHLANDDHARRTVVHFLRRLRPRVVVTHWRDGRHPDHRVAAELAWDACFLAGIRKFGGALPAFRPQTVAYATGFREDADPPSFVVDITETLEAKLDAVACYASQFAGKTRAGEIQPGGDRPLAEQIRAHAAASGSRIRVAYGEPFRVRETHAVTSLADLDLKSF